MTKSVILLVITATVVTTYALTGDPAATAILGSAVAIGGLLALRFTRPTEPEATSEKAPPPILPTFVPSVIDPVAAAKRRHKERIAAISAPVIDEDGEVLPPTPNIGQDDKPYRGPRYFDMKEN